MSETTAISTTYRETIRAAAADAVRRTVLDARENGWPLVVTRDGEVVHLPADEFVLPGEEGEPTAGAVAIAADDSPSSVAGK